ncbi:MAG: hypothetical protein IKC94_04015, partial [Lentisphaeria bacterium]|nr:hypothetical protein [Lentisphaeria bacterium]
MRQFLKIPPEWTCNFRLSTLIAIAAGLGAASGYGLLSAFWLLLPGAGMLLLSRKQLYCVLIAFTLCFISGNLNRYTDRIKNDAVPMHTQTVSGTILCIDNRCSALDELPPLRSYLCEIQTEKGRFTATVLFPDSPRIFYGDAFNFTGIVVPPKPAGLLINSGEVTGALPPG